MFEQEIDLLLQNTRSLSSAQILEELKQVLDKVAFSDEINTLFSYDQEMVISKQVEAITSYFIQDVSPEFLAFLNTLAAYRHLKVLTREHSFLFFAACQEELANRPEIIISTAIALSSSSAQTLEQLFKSHRGSVRVVIQHNPKLVAGCIIEEAGERHDYSLRHHGLSLIQAYFNHQSTPGSYAQPKSPL